MFEGVDLDWFATSGTNIIHLASGGGTIPALIDEEIENVAKAILGMPEISPEIVINESLGNYVQFSNKNQFDNYIISFVAYAKRGLFSYDKTLLNDSNNPLYHLVASPINALRVEALPKEVRIFVPKTKDFLVLPLNQINIDLLF